MTESRDPWADWSGRTPLFDAGDRLLLVFTASEHAYQGQQWADGVWRPGDVPVAEAVAAAQQAFAGWAVSTSDDELAGGLVAVGAETLRHAHLLSHDLTSVPAEDPPVGLVVDALDAESLAELADALGPTLLTAYPAGHSDHSHDTVEASVQALHRVAAGEVLGALLDISTAAWSDGGVVGACLVVAREGTAPEGGAWLLDIFRDPATTGRGIGRALLVETLRLCRQSGLPALSLAVSDGNVAARRLYGAIGFDEASASRTLLMP